MPLQERMRRIEQRADHVVFGIAEARVVEAHALRPAARKISTLLRASPGGWQRRPRQLQVVVPVREVEVGVLQEGGRRQQDVGVVGGVGLELLEHDGEQILAAQAAQHRVLIGRDRRGVGVVDHHRLHRRIVQLGQRLPQLATC